MRFPALAALAVLVSVPLAAPAVAQQSLSQTLDQIDPKERPASFRDLSKRLMPAVVNISTSKTVAPSGTRTEGSPVW